jgi:hypothetical protein
MKIPLPSSGMRVAKTDAAAGASAPRVPKQLHLDIEPTALAPFSPNLLLAQFPQIRPAPRTKKSSAEEKHENGNEGHPEQETYPGILRSGQVRIAPIQDAHHDNRGSHRAIGDSFENALEVLADRHACMLPDPRSVAGI